MSNHEKSFAILFTLAALGAMSFGCAPAGDEEKNTATMKRFYDEVMSKGNLKVIDELVADNFIDHLGRDPRMSAGKASWHQGMAMTRTAFPDLQVTLEDLIAKGDKVWAYIVMRGTHKGDFMGMKPTGKEIEINGIDIFRFVNGKVVEHWGMKDGLAMMQQLEAMEWREPTKQ